jgi:signal peptidase II
MSESARRFVSVFSIMAVLIGIDQATKFWAKVTLKGQGVYRYLGDTFRLEYSENPGAFLGLGGELPESARFWIFTALVAAFLIYAFVQMLKAESSIWTALALSLLVGGGVGNLIDRIAYGWVIDFMNMGIGNLRTGIFNVADMAIMAAVGVLMAEPWLQRRRVSSKSAS